MIAKIHKNNTRLTIVFNCFSRKICKETEHIINDTAEEHAYDRQVTVLKRKKFISGGMSRTSECTIITANVLSPP